MTELRRVRQEARPSQLQAADAFRVIRIRRSNIRHMRVGSFLRSRMLQPDGEASPPLFGAIIGAANMGLIHGSAGGVSMAEFVLPGSPILN